MLTENLGWMLFSEKFIPRFLTAEQKEERSGDINTGGQNQEGARQSKSNVKTMFGVFFDFHSRFDVLRVRSQQSNSESRILADRFTASARKSTKETTGP
jgi:hypothetical protein